MSDFGYYLNSAREFDKMLKEAYSIPPKKYGIMLQQKKKSKKKKRGNRQ